MPDEVPHFHKVRESRPVASLAAAEPLASFADRVAFTVLLERTLPPYNPPSLTNPQAASGALFVLALAMAALTFTFFSSLQAWAAVTLLLSAIMAALAWMNYKQAVDRRSTYDRAFEAAKDVATKLLSGTANAANGETERELDSLRSILAKLAAPASGGGSWFVFVWWSE